MPFLELDFRLHYKFHREPDKPVLILSNSLGTNLEMWTPQIAAWAQDFSLLRYDARGHGASSATPGPYSISLLGEDVLRLMDALKIHHAHFCGLSMGGMVAQWLGIHAAERVDKLVLCNTAAKIGDDAGWNRRIATVRESGMQAIVPSVIERWFTSEFRRNNADEVEATAAMLQFANREGYTATCAAIRDMDLREEVQQIKARTLVVCGEHDQVTPPSASHFLLEQIKGSRLLSLKAAHLSNLEAASAFTAGVSAFLDDPDSEGVSHG